MSKKRISGSGRRTSRPLKDFVGPEGWPARAVKHGLKVHHFAGIALAGGKTDKTCLAMIEYYPDQNKIFLVRLFEKIRSDREHSADLELHGLLSQVSDRLEMVAVDAPLRLPKCLRCKLKCPGFELCTEPEVEWMWRHYTKLNKQRKPRKLFTPYTERAVEMHLASDIEEVFHLPHALGSNMAPLTARAIFVSRRLKTPFIEVFPKLSLWRIGRALNISKSHLMFHRHSVDGHESRRIIIQRLVEHNLTFVYEQDQRTMIENNQSFEAFIAALTAVFDFKGECEPRPKGFPKGEDWISFPKVNLKI